MLQKAAEERDRVEGAPLGGAGATVAVAEGHVAVGEPFEPTVQGIEAGIVFFGIPFAVLALLVSGLSLFISYSTSPLSNIARPAVVYDSVAKIIRWEDRDDVGLLMTGVVRNETNNPAKNVIVSVFSVPTHEPKLQVVVQSGIEHEVLVASDHIATIMLHPYSIPSTSLPEAVKDSPTRSS